MDSTQRVKHPESGAELKQDLFSLRRGEQSALQKIVQGIPLNKFFQNNNFSVLFRHLHDLGKMRGGNGKQFAVDFTIAFKMTENILCSVFLVSYNRYTSARITFELF